MKKVKKQQHRHLGYILAVGFVLFTVSRFVFASEITSENVVKLVNEAREKEGLGQLAESKALDEAAREKAADMIKNDYFAHTSPLGLTPWHWFEKNDYDYRYAGENLAINFQNAEDEQSAWMASPTHRKNILNPNYREVGVAVVSGQINGREAIIAVQEFGARMGTASGMKREESVPSEAGGAADKIKAGAPIVLSMKNVADSADSQKSSPMNMDFTVGFLQALAVYFLFIVFISIPLAFTWNSWRAIIENIGSLNRKTKIKTK